MDYMRKTLWPISKIYQSGRQVIMVILYNLVPELKKDEKYANKQQSLTFMETTADYKCKGIYIAIALLTIQIIRHHVVKLTMKYSLVMFTLKQ